jgi:ParB family chromosome partitioning protein
MLIPNPVQESAWLDLSLLDFRPDARVHSEEEITKLAKSMSVRQLQSIIVCRNADRYEAIAGVGRVLAARKLGWEKIRADVYEGLTELQKLSVVFDENEDREDPPALYQAKVLQSMMQADKLSQEDLAEKVDKDRTTVTKYLALLSLSPAIWEDVNRFTSLGIKQFMQISRIEIKDDQWKVAKVAVEKDLSTLDLQRMIDKMLGVEPEKKKMGRPKGTKSLGSDGFEVKKKKGNLQIRAILTETSDLDDFISRLREEILRLRTPQPAVPQAGNGSEKVPAGVAG